MTIESILKKGSVAIRVKHEGILQSHTFTVIKEKTPFGEVPFLVSSYDLSKLELLRIAQETGLPVKSPALTAFPPGKMLKDLVTLK